MSFAALLFLFALDGSADLVPLKNFEVPDHDEFLRMAHASCFGPQDRLYVMDPSQPRILIWHADGRFYKAFGTQGQGPGEIMEPINIAPQGDNLFVWQRNGKMTRFSADGEYRDSFRLPGPWPRRFTMLDKDRAFINYRQISGPSEAYYVFDIRNRQGAVSEVEKFRNKGLLEVADGNNNASIRAYMGDVDIQRAPDGSIWYGFGYEHVLYHMDADGKLLGKQSFDLPLEKPSDEDQAHVENKEISLPDGRLLKVKNLPNLKIHFEYDKGYFTQFVIKGDKVAFILTSKGGTDTSGDGDSRASYQISDMKTGKRLARGAYELPEGSQVHYRDGRIIAMSLDEDDNFKVQEVTLRGL